MNYATLDQGINLAKAHIVEAKTKVDNLVAQTSPTKTYRDQLEGVVSHHECELVMITALKDLILSVELKVNEVIGYLTKIDTPGPPHVPKAL